VVTFLCVLQPNDNYNPDADDIAFPRQNGIRDASLVLLKEKSGRISLLRVSNDSKNFGNFTISDRHYNSVVVQRTYTSTYIIVTRVLEKE